MTLGEDLAGAALLLVDVQRGFDDPRWGARNNPACEPNIARLLTHWQSHGRPTIFARHASRDPDSPLAAGAPGYPIKDVIVGEPDLLVTKQVNSCFYGQPDLHGWLERAGIGSLVIAGITTNHCCETTARMAGNLGYRTCFAIDATHTFDRRLPDGRRLTADQLRDATAANLHDEFATVLTTHELLRS